ncbi:cytochrome P450 [Candidatus Palauibacter sp.]|uniref:cytochrome P450 n=1 Tax=Candidatus Palauibacter sp. TaxID=3101350 RepID=UPI003B5991F9
MAVKTEDVATQALSLPEELILMLLNEESGYFHQVPGWELNCAVAGAVLAELSLQSRIDTDMESLFLVDPTETGDPVLDPFLEEIAAAPRQRTARYWIERLAPQAESIIDRTLERLVDLNILEHHDGDFWTLARGVWESELYAAAEEGTARQFIKTRIGRVIFTDEIPDPRDVIIICLVNTCDVFRYIFQLDEEAEERIEFICRMDLIGRSIAAAVVHNLAGPLLRRSALSKHIPKVKARHILLNPHLRSGNLPAIVAELAKEYGPVFELRPPFKEPMLILVGPETNRWAHRHGRIYVRTKDYFADFEKVYGANGVLPSLDGADHFRLRKAISPAYSRGRLADQADVLYEYARNFMADWKVGDTYQARSLCRRMANGQISPLSVSVDSQDIFDDLSVYKERALTVKIMKAMPGFMLKTPGMKRRAATVDTLLKRVQSVHTTEQRAGCPRDLADDWLSLHASDPQFVPQSNLRFALSAALVASVYLGDALSFVVYAMATQPELYERIRSEADALFADGDPDANAITGSSIDVTHRFLMESLRMYPVVPGSMRTVMNSCMVEGYELPVGSNIFIASTASHYMEDVFPDPFSFDIDRYLPPRDEHKSPGYAPYGLGTHTCLGFRWMELQLAVNVLMIAHYFRLEVPEGYKFKFDPLPSMKPNKKLKFHIAEQHREIPV